MMSRKHTHSIFKRASSVSSDSGVALVIVLSVIVLLTVLVVSFLSRTTAERASVAAYYEANRNSFLADTAVNIVQAQIGHASSETSDSGTPLAWASQPGMVRTFNQYGRLLRAYKLYSDDQMVLTEVDSARAVENLAAWWDKPAHYVDLNAPVVGKNKDGKNVLRYPIIDNAVLGNETEKAYTNADNSFSVTEQAPVNAGDSDRQKIPMPVKWLYVLEDGSTVAPAGSGSTATITGASRSNPIVGRIAFWTDDETCKLNINTASAGHFWDIPRVSSEEDRDKMALFQPARNEFQRYPGHPAMTSLRPAFAPDLFSNDDEFEKFAYQIAPRISEGGSKGGTVFATGTVILDTDRLYSTVDELFYKQPTSQDDSRPEQLEASEIEKAKFFLTARSNAPELNLFNLPRMAIWPINSGTKTASTLEETIQFCSTINGQKYYFQREDPNSSTHDISRGFKRNENLWTYINTLLKQPMPGFGAATFGSKYTTAETDQITTEIFDYIRSSNLYFARKNDPATPYTGDVQVIPASLEYYEKPGTRVGQVTPMKYGNTKGFGRLPTISRAILQFFISGAEALDSAGNVADTWTCATIGNDYKPTPQYTENGADAYVSWKGFLKRTGDKNRKIRLLTTGIVYFDTFDPNLGYVIPRYNFEINVNFTGGAWEVEGLDAGGIKILGPHSLNFRRSSTLKINIDQNHVYNAWADSVSYTFFGRILGGALGPQWLIQNYSYMQYPGGLRSNNLSGPNASGINYERLFNLKRTGYPLVSDAVRVHDTISLLPPPPAAAYTLPERNVPLSSRQANDDHALAVPVNFENGKLHFSGGNMKVEIVAGGPPPQGNGGEVVQTYTFDFPSFTKPSPAYLDNNTHSAVKPKFVFDKDKQFPISADFRNRLGWAYHQHGFTDPGRIGNVGNAFNTPDLRLVQDGDVAVSLVPKQGDKRLLAAKSTLDSVTDFQPQALYSTTGTRAAVDFRADTVGTQGYRGIAPGSSQVRPGRILDINYGRNALPDMPGHFPRGVQSQLGLKFPPDFDNGPFFYGDDTYINRADEGSVTDRVSTGESERDLAWYYDRADRSRFEGQHNPNFYSPMRQMPSAAMFGSLPTGVVRDKPWQTLLFRPDPGNHPGAQDPPDYALLDLFWMPVVEPYAISEPFSTNGKVNMNFQIMPFSYIYRGTAMHGVLKDEQMLAIPNSTAGSGNNNGTGVLEWDEYKKYDGDNIGDFSKVSYRKKIDVVETLKGFTHKFDKNEIFLSETQICSLPMVPEGATWNPNFESWWKDYALTGDNSRERIYVDLLPRLTTRSNTYTVHYKVQSLKKRPAATDAEAATWDESKDSVTAETRGSRVIERYIDPNDTTITDYAASNNPLKEKPLAEHFRWRSLGNREFAP